MPSGGLVRIGGVDVAGLGDRELSRLRARRIGFVFQQFFLAERASVRENVADGLLYAGVPAAERHRRADEVLERVGLSARASFTPSKLSGGERQRVAIARALGTGPDVLLADEPVSMLDVSIRLEILNLLDALKRERNLAMLYVTHDLATARHFSTEIMVMYRGEIVERGPSDEVILNPAHPYTQLLAAAAPNPAAPRAEQAAARRARQAVRAARTAERRETAVDQGCRFRARCPHAMEVCQTRPPDLQVTAGHLARCWLYGGSRPDATSAAGAEVR
jgi:peptide/nickel transport system ATP-binding protein